MTLALIITEICIIIEINDCLYDLQLHFVYRFDNKLNTKLSAKFHEFSSYTNKDLQYYRDKIKLCRPFI